MGMACASDDEVWNYARDNDYTIVTKDADFSERSLLRGFPPKVVWIRRGNCSTNDIEKLLREHREIIVAFDVDQHAAVLQLS